MSTPPTGTVTFLFTDIEGSTTRWEHHRAAMRSALDRHNALVSAAIDAHGGFVFKTVGDAFCAAFANPADAAQAAIDAQRALAAENWARFGPDFPFLRVRMALHTGAAEHQDGDYLGPPLNRVARLLATAHGGQVLVSLATQQLVRDQLPEGAALVDLGVHRLKDLKRTEHLFRVVAAGFPDIATPPDTAEQLPAGARTHVEADGLPAECPYRGLLAFRENDAPFFFGRETFTARLVAAVTAKPMVGVIGPSGSGKSSVVYAGMLPALRQATPKVAAGAGTRTGTATGTGIAADGGDSGWTILRLRPGADPFDAVAGVLVPYLEPDMSHTARLVETARLAEALAGGTLDVRKVVASIRGANPALGRVLFVIDQFEELYTLCPDARVQRAFQDLVFEAAHKANGSDRGAVKLALTLRADFMGHATAYRPFADAIQDHNVILGPMNREELTAAIVKPAELQGRAFESGLVERILADVGEEAGQLPLLEFALTKLWDGQQNGWLTHEAYEAIGRVEGAVARHADAVLDGLPSIEQDGCRRVFVQMVRPGEGTEDTRRLATKEELGEDWPLIRRLADARLVVTNRDAASGRETVEVVHEALIRSWGQLKGWMNADRAFRTWQERVRFAAKQWAATGEDEGALLRGVPLAEAEGWLTERDGELAPAERAYVEASVAQQARRVAQERERAERERAQQIRTLALERRGHRLVRVVAGVAVVGAIVAGALAASAQRSADRAQRLAMVSKSRELLAQGLADPALAIAAEALAGASDLPQSELAFAEAAYAPGAKWVAEAPADLLDLALSPDGAILLTGDKGGAIRLWDASTGKEIRAIESGGGEINAVAWLPSGKGAVSGSSRGEVVVWDTEKGQATRKLHEVAGIAGSVWSVGVSPDGLLALTGTSNQLVRLWDLEKGVLLKTLQGHNGNVRSTVFLPDGRRAVTAASTQTEMIVWDLTTGKEIRRLRGLTVGVIKLVVSRDGRQVIGIGGDATLRVWDVETGAVTQAMAGHPATPGTGLALSADGLQVASGAGDAVIRIWDVATGRQTGQLNGHRDLVVGLAYSPDNTALFSASRDRTLRKWQMKTAAQLFSRSYPEDTRLHAYGLAISPDGRLCLTGYGDGTARLQEIATGTETRILAGHNGTVNRAAFSPDGRQVATGSNDLTVRMWDLATGELKWRGEGHTGDVYGLAYSPDGSVVASGSQGGDSSILLWDAESGRRLLRLATGGSVHSMAFAPDGRRLVATATRAGETNQFELQVWRLPEGRLERRLIGHTAGLTMDMAPDGKHVASGSLDRTLRIWDLATGQETQRADFEDAIWSVKFSPDGRTIAVGLSSAGAAIWDIARHAVIRRYLGTQGALTDMAFTPDGRVLAAAVYHPAGMMAWHVDPDLASLVDWTGANRHLDQLTCFDRQVYGTLLRCGPDDKPLPAPDLAALAKGFPKSSARIASVAPQDGPTLADFLQARDTAHAPPTPLNQPAASFQVHHEPLNSVSLSADGRFFVTSAGYAGDTAATNIVPQEDFAALWDSRTGALVRRFEGHGNSVRDAALSPDGRRLVSCGLDYRVAMWDVESGKALWGHGTKGQCLWARFDPASKRMAYASGDPAREASILDVETGKELAQLGPHGANVTDLAFSSDGKQLLTGSGDLLVRLWDIDSGKPLLTMGGGVSGHTAAPMSVAFDPSNRRAVTGGLDGIVIVWDLASGKELRRFEGHDEAVSSVLFDPSGTHVISAGNDGTIRVWDVDSGEESTRFKARAARLDVSNDGRFIVSGGANGAVQVWPLADGAAWEPPAASGVALAALIPNSTSPGNARAAHPGVQRGELTPGAIDRWPLDGFANTVLDIRVSADKPVTFTINAKAEPALGYLDLRAVVRGPDGGILAQSDDRPGSRADPAITNLVLPAGASSLLDVAGWPASASGGYTLSITSVPLIRSTLTIGEPLVGRPPDRLSVLGLAISPDGQRVLAGGGNWQNDNRLLTELPVRMWDLATGKLVRAINTGPRAEAVHTEATPAYVFTPDGNHALVGSVDGRLVLWDLDNGQVVRRYEGHRGGIRDVARSPDGRVAASCGDDSLIIVWDVDTGREIKRFDGLTSSFYALAFRPDGHSIVAATSSGTVLEWLFETSADPRWLTGVGGATIRSLAIDRSGTRVVTGSFAGTVALWDLTLGEPVRRMTVPTWIAAVDITQDGKLAASGEANGTIRLWRLDTGEEAARLLGHVDVARALAFTPDGKRLVSASYDGSLRVWDVAGVAGAMR